MPLASSSSMSQLMDVYPSDVNKGSPFNTAYLNAITTEFKRIAAILGDPIFQAPRRFFLQETSEKQDTWAFGTCYLILGVWNYIKIPSHRIVSKRMKDLPLVGSVRYYGTTLDSHTSEPLFLYIRSMARIF